MSHLHIPDGIIALWLWALGYILVGLYFIIFAKRLKKTSNYKKLAIVSVLGALMLLAMSIPVPFVIPYHINLSALLGIIAGPFYAGVTIFSVNLILALIGHGGLTIVGLNTVVLMAEAAVAYYLFNLLRKKLNNKTFISGVVSTFIALVVSAALTIGIIYAGTQNLGHLAHHDHDHYCEHCPEQEHEDHEEHEHEHDEEDFDVKRFFVLVLISGAFGWTLESLLTGFIVNYIQRVKPDLLERENN